jgi:fatty acid synthase
LQVQPEDKVTEVKVKAVARSACDPHKAYVVAGGLGGFGLELCAWLVERGARHLVLVSRSGVTTGYQSRRVREWRESGVKVAVSSRDVTKRDDVVALLSEPGCEIGGVFNLAMVLADGMMENQTVDSFKRVCQPKVQATATLDAVTRQLDVCRHMQWFVAFSSVSCGRGNAGQANYGFANSVMERICEQRQRDGLPG